MSQMKRQVTTMHFTILLFPLSMYNYINTHIYAHTKKSKMAYTKILIIGLWAI